MSANLKLTTDAPTLNAIFIQNKDSGLYSGYIEEIRGVVAQGVSIEETQEKLFVALKFVLDSRRNDGYASLPSGAKKIPLSIQPLTA